MSVSEHYFLNNKNIFLILKQQQLVTLNNTFHHKDAV